MSVTHVQGNSNSASGNQASISVLLTGVAAGDLIVVNVHWGGAGFRDTISSVSDGTSTLTALSLYASANPDASSGQTFYLLSANDGNKTYTATFAGGTGSFPIIYVSQFHTVSGTWVYDASNGGVGTSTTAADTGPITTTGSLEAVTFSNKNYAFAANVTNPLVDGVTPTSPPYSIADNYFYYLPTAPFTGDGTLTWSAMTDWVALLAAFKVVGGVSRLYSIPLLGAGPA